MNEGVASFLVNYDGNFLEDGGKSEYIGGKTRSITLPCTSGFDELRKKIHERIGARTVEKIGVKCQVPFKFYHKFIFIDIEDDEDLKVVVEMSKNSAVSVGMLYVTTAPESISKSREEWIISILPPPNVKEEATTTEPKLGGEEEASSSKPGVEEEASTSESKPGVGEKASTRESKPGVEEKATTTKPSVEEKSTTTENKLMKMPKVPPILLRDAKGNFEGHYKPSVVSIGPYHSGQPGLEQVQKLKPMIAGQFHGKKTIEDLRGFFERFEEKINEQNFKDPYSKNMTEPIDEKLKRMMFLDGCFILGFIQCIVNNEGKMLGMKNYLIKSVPKDLFLLENQLPYEVLQVLIKLMCNGEIPFTWEHNLSQFVDYSNNLSWRKYKAPQGPQDVFRDLLDSLAFLWEKLSSQDKTPAHLLHFQWTRLLGKPCGHMSSSQPRCREIQSFRGVKELMEAGIKLRPNKTGHIKDVNFRSYCICGYLTLPRMIIDGSTKPMFFNLIAYEAAEVAIDNAWFTSYINFLDLLIDNVHDVKELRSAGILDNRLGNDEDVAKLFNEIGEDLGPVTDTFEDIKGRIRRHFSVRKRIWIWMLLWVVEGFCNYFNNPITYVAVLVGLIGLFLTVVQTYFTAFSPKP